jgi:cellulose synthase/poly-beta-1,6-N-acetylglucosamine synthase-like glycosyltransferase
MFLFSFICLFLLALYGLLIEYYRRAWQAIPVYSSQPAAGPAPRTRISVLIPARNEEENITACLGSLFRQSYPRELYQVIVIDDHSKDRTWEILESVQFPGMSFSSLRLGSSEPEPAAGPESAVSPRSPKGASPVKAYKKLAIEAGVLAATGDLIVTTDADCLFHPDWLKTIARFYEETGAKFIAAPVKIGGDYPESRSSGHSFLAVFQTLDFISLQGITGASVYKKFHSMCNGANLAYEKKAFLEVEGFRDIDNIPSGDDMLLMHKIFMKYPGRVFFLKNRQAMVCTRPETSWKGFFNQRIRWASKADSYDDRRIFRVLLYVYLLNLLLLGLVLASFWNAWYLWLLLLLLIVKTAVEYPFVRSVASFFGQQKLMVYFPVMEPFHVLYTVGIGWLGKFGSYRWKERKISK